MVRLLALFLILFSPVAFAAFQVGSAVPAIGLDHNGATPAASSFIGLSDVATANSAVFHVVGGDVNTPLSAANFYPLYYGGAPYKVSAGKTAYCYNIFCGGGASDAQFVDDTIAINYNSGALSASGVYQGGQAAKYPLNCPATAGFQTGYFPAGQNRYVGFQVGGSAALTFQADCIER